LADLVVLEANPLAVAPEDLDEVRVEMTFVGGREMYVRP
jgi:predicted amidohydrolase YtcJ